MYWFGDSIGHMKWQFLVFPFSNIRVFFFGLDVKSKVSLAKHPSCWTKSLVASTILGPLGYAESIGGDRLEEFND